MTLFATAAPLRCHRHFTDTTYPTGTGLCSNPICRGVRGFGGWRGTTANFSMPCSGFFAPARRGETFQPRMVGGKTPVGVFAAGVIDASHCKVHPHAASARRRSAGWQSGHAPYIGRLNTKIRSRMHSSISSDGGTSPRATRKRRLIRCRLANSMPGSLATNLVTTLSRVSAHQ